MEDGYPHNHESNLKEHPTTPLRQRFIEDMHLCGLAPTTQRSYVHYVAGFAEFYNTSPERLDLEAIRQYELYLLLEKKMPPETINSFDSAVQFLYLITLEMPWGKGCFPRVRRLHKLPVVLSPEEVSRFFQHVGCLKRRAALMLCYGAGLRISEAVKIRIGDIDSDRMMIRIEELLASLRSPTAWFRKSVCYRAIENRNVLMMLPVAAS